MPRPLKSYFLVLIGLCLAVNLCLTVLVAGIDVTPWETKDSQGRTMGFNDRFSPEHYRIALGNFHPAALFKWQYSYEWLLLAAQGVALWCLWSAPRSARRATRWYFLVQPAVFFIGTISLVFLMPPNLLADVLNFRADRETFVDIPFLEVMAQAPWVIVSWTIAVALPGQSLGLGEAWTKIRRWLRKRQPATHTLSPRGSLTPDSPAGRDGTVDFAPASWSAVLLRRFGFREGGSPGHLRRLRPGLRRAPENQSARALAHSTTLREAVNRMTSLVPNPV